LSYYEKVKYKLFHYQQDLYGLELLRPLTNKFSAAPLFTGHALRPIELAMMVNDLVINRRKSVLELGAGASTLYLAKAIEVYGLDCKIYSVDENQAWLDLVKEMLAAEKIDHLVTFIQASSKTYEEGKWYDKEKVAEGLKDTRPIECLIVDGPCAGPVDGPNNRYAAMPELHDKLSDRCIVFLDDTNRPGEMAIAKRWSDEFGLKFSHGYGSFGLATRGETFNIWPVPG